MDHRGRIIRARRDELDWTITQAAEKCGVTISTMSLLENGKMPNASFNVIVKVARGLGLSLDALAEPIPA